MKNIFKPGYFLYENLSKMIEKDRLKRNTEAKNQLRAKLKYFKLEVTQSFWGKKVTYIQRDKPLTDLEIQEILK